MAVTPNFNCTLPDVGGSENNWGNLINTAFTAFDGAFESSVLKMSYGGTGATSATSARTALGLGTLATQNANYLSVGTLNTSGNVGLNTTPTVEADINGNVQASSLVTVTGSSSVSQLTTVFGTTTVGTLTANTNLRIPNLSFLVDNGENRILGFGCETKITSDITNIVNGSYVDISWQAENFDDANMWTSGSSISLPKAGLYLVTVSLGWYCTSTGNVLITVIKGGTDLSSTHGFRTVNGTMIITTQHVFNITSPTTISVRLTNNSGSTGEIRAAISGNDTRINVRCLGTF